MAREMPFVAPDTISLVELRKGIQIALYCWMRIIKGIAQQDTVSLHLPFLDLSLYPLFGIVKFVLTYPRIFGQTATRTNVTEEVRGILFLVEANTSTDGVIIGRLSCHREKKNSD